MSDDVEERLDDDTFWSRALGFFVDNKLVVLILAGLLILGGLMTAPFRWEIGSLPRDPAPVDAIPDIGENQQIVFTEWPGRSPRDVEDQISYPLTTALLGISGVRTVRSFSMFLSMTSMRPSMATCSALRRFRHVCLRRFSASWRAKRLSTNSLSLTMEPRKRCSTVTFRPQISMSPLDTGLVSSLDASPASRSSCCDRPC